MIPRLNLHNVIDENYAQFIEALTKTSFSGEIRTDYGSRLITSTDNSIYQILPQAIVFPRSSEDLTSLFTLAKKDQFSSIKFSPRGGGTGTNGQSLSAGIIIDCSKYMNQILEINLKEKWVRAQPGVVLDQLNDFLKKDGVFFAPSLSPSNRATLGGMINTDACGKGSRIYGKTSNHVMELSYVFQDGTTWTSSEVDLAHLEQLKKRKDIIGSVYRQVDEITTAKRELIKNQFPKMSRFMTGYNLANVYSEQADRFNLNYILSGSEGTLVMITEAKLKLTSIPKYKQLLVVKYQSFDDGLSDALRLLSNNPAAIETIDEKILTLAKEDEIYYYVKDFINDEDHASTKTINLLEFTGNNQKELEQSVQALCQQIEKDKNTPNRAIGYYHTTDPNEITHLWNLRNKGVGLLGNTKGSQKPIPFIEDTAVPPEKLAQYIAELKSLLEEHGLEYGMFGHVDVGCLHVRPALDMKEPKDEKLIRVISDKVAELVQKYGGVMWAEHGRGYRSEYAPRFFGRELYQDLRKIKEAFDPDNKMNPGKIVSPFSKEDKVVPLEGRLRGHYDRQISHELQVEYEGALNCNGNGVCYSYDPHDVMCPSSKATRDRIHSPKGRADMMREWLRQASPFIEKFDVQIEPVAPQNEGLVRRSFKNTVQFYKKFKNTYAKSRGDFDFSHEVYDAMNGCLACKACATQCPIHVDIPELRSKFYNIYFSRYLRPIRDYLIGYIEYIIPKQARLAKLYNRLLKIYAVDMVLTHIVRLCNPPKMSTISVKDALNQRHAPLVDLTKLENLSSGEKERSVILLQDVFTTYFEAELVLDIYDFVRMLGYVVYIMPFSPSGKPMHVKGFMNPFKALAKKNADYLEQLGKTGIPMIGIEPSIVLTYRDEYQKVLEKENLGFKVELIQEWLIIQKSRFEKLFPENNSASNRISYQLLGHCNEKTGALDSQKQWQQIFDIFGLELELLASGCCGMCGTYGHESEHYSESRDIYLMSWGKHITDDEKQRAHVLATGYSCRTQVQRFDGFKPLHPIQALLQNLSRKKS